jgi:sugar phosphate isomerase/epimerase
LPENMFISIVLSLLAKIFLFTAANSPSMSKLYVQPLVHEMLPEFIAFAQQNSYNLELATFAYANAYDTDWDQVLRQHKLQLIQFTGQVSLHGVYRDIIIHSNDSKIAEVSRERIQGSIEVAKALDVKKIVFHAGVNSLVLDEWYLKNWLEKNAAFWKEVLVEYTGTVLIENVWELKPDILRSLLDTVDSSRLKICLDVAHAHVYSKVPLETWLSVLGEDVVYMHISDNNGLVDQHLEVGAGNIDWQSLTQSIQNRGLCPDVVLEECTLDHTQASIDYLKNHKIYPFST